MQREQNGNFISKSWNGLSLNNHLQINFLTVSWMPLKSIIKQTIAVNEIKFKNIILYKI